jgi:hypothetical protein
LQFLRDQEKHFEGFIVKNISRNDNSDADELAKAATQNSSLPQDVFYQILKQASIKAVQATPREIHIIQVKTGEPQLWLTFVGTMSLKMKSTT